MTSVGSVLIFVLPHVEEGIIGHLEISQQPGSILPLGEVAVAASHTKLWNAAYALAVLLMSSVVFILYWNRGVLVCIRILGYLMALSTMKLSVKNLYVNSSFYFPQFVTCLHFVCCVLLSLAIMFWRHQTSGRPIFVPSGRQFFLVVCPVAVSAAISVASNNIALGYANVAFIEMMGGLAPILVVMLTVALGRRYDWKLTGPVCTVCTGVGLCAYGELQFSMIGLLLALFATLMRAAKATFQQVAMDPERDGAVSFEPAELCLWTSLPSFIGLGIWSWFSEGTAPFVQMYSTPAPGLFTFNMIITCANACILNLSALFAAKDLGAVTFQVAGQLKGLLILLGGIAFFDEKISAVQILAYAIILLGVFWYQRMDSKPRTAPKTSKCHDGKPAATGKV